MSENTEIYSVPDLTNVRKKTKIQPPIAFHNHAGSLCSNTTNSVILQIFRDIIKCRLSVDNTAHF